MTDFSLTPQAKAAYSVQDYSPRRRIEGVETLPFRRFVDDGGSFFEMGRLNDSAELLGLPGFQVRQISYSEVLPGAIKAFHMHLHQADIWFVPPAHRLLVGLYDARSGSPTEGETMRLVLGDGQTNALYIPSGVAHGCTNAWNTPSSVIYFVNRHFSPNEDTDEGRLPWDFLGADFWAIQQG